MNMNKTTKLSLFQTIAVVLLSGCAMHQTGWKLVWTENFKGKTIDERVWSRIGKGGSDWDDMMSLRSDLAYVEDGQLQKAKKLR